MEQVLERASDRYVFDMGGYSRPVRTVSPEAQLWFDRGLAWCYGFNHDEAIRCFERAARADPDCAMAHWGIAYAAGCNYNKPWEAFLEGERAAALGLAYDAAHAAQAAVDRAGEDAWPAERALIGALPARYPAREAPEGTPFQAWNDGYAAAMRQVYARFPDDPDVAALFAEALINRTPWQLWDLPTGTPREGADTLEAQAVLERAIAARESAGEAPHPGQLHAYLHTMEMSPTPERALRAADALRDLVPDAGHLRHMASHIDVLCGHYHASLVANERAIEADDRYFAATGEKGFYTLYRCHDIHFKIYSAMFLGQLRPALEGARQLREALPESVLRIETPPMADWTEGFLGMGVHALVRFGRWQDLLALPLPADPELYCVTTAMTRYGRGIAYASLGDVEAAEAEQRAFREAVERVPESRTVFNNTCRAILGVAEAMLDGELTYRRGDHDAAFAKLRRAAELSDGLTYDEPWGWMQPVRHALGALLLEQGRVEEALEAYRDDLGLSGRLPRAHQHPDNVWALAGLVECLERLGRGDEAAPFRQRLALARARADVEVATSCFCRLDTRGAPVADGAHAHRDHGAHGGHVVGDGGTGESCH
ncbi:MAG TPA: tetratricopeptide repeat protein [Trueperaceae bacterium]